MTDGRAPSIWDTFCEKGLSDEDGLIACDHYNRLERPDHIAVWVLMRIGSRSAGPGSASGDGPWNEKGFDFYDRLISGLEQREYRRT